MRKSLYKVAVAMCLLVVSLGSAHAAGALPAPKLNRVPGTTYELRGIGQEYLNGITENWLLRMPDANPAILQMFADRDQDPHRNLLPWSGEFAGKYLTGATQVLRLTHDPKLKAYVAQFVAQLVQLQAEDGYLGPFSREHRLEGKGTWDVWGHYHIMLGLLLWHEDTGDQKALDCAVKIGDLLCRKFLHTGKRIVDTGSVEMNHAAIHSLGLLYEVTKTPAYLELARQIVDEFQDARAGDYVRVALSGKEYYQGPKPRWESLHSIQGVAELYWLTGNDDYRKAFEQLWWSIDKLDRHNNGGFSSGEQAQGNPYHPGAIETCCTVAWIALGVDMLRLTGNSVVADELELSTLNQVLGYENHSGKWCTYNTPMDGVRGNSTQQIAFQIRPGSEEINCCSANAPRGFGMISDWALMTDGQGLVVNWYGPSTMNTKLKNTVISLQQQTEYPRDGRVVLKVSPEHALRFPLKLRIPNWSAQSRVLVNGKAVSGVKPGHYLVLDRKWKPGDTVQLDLDFSLHYWVGEQQCEGKASIYRGPLLLVYEFDREQAIANPGLNFSPEWTHRDSSSVTKHIGATLEAKFEGANVTWKGRRYDDAGQVRVQIDGQEIAVVDQYGPKRDEPFTWEYHNLSPGQHTLKFTVLESKHPDSKEHWINVSRITPAAYAGPLLDAATLTGKVLPPTGSAPCLLAMEFTTTDGKKVKLRDYGTAGENGAAYLSWLKVQNVTPTPFSETNPLRSSPAKK